MDLYDLSFFLSTMWIGPFWIAMLLYPNHEKTHQLMEGPWFFLGPILIWYLVSFSDISGLIDLFVDTMDPNLALQSLADAGFVVILAELVDSSKTKKIRSLYLFLKSLCSK